jgi:hypothetical protein
VTAHGVFGPGMLVECSPLWPRGAVTAAGPTLAKWLG